MFLSFVKGTALVLEGLNSNTNFLPFSSKPNYKSMTSN